METKQDYINYQARFEAGTNGLEFISTGINSKCTECQCIYGYENEHEFEIAVENQDVLDEGSFSNSYCDICGSMLGGDKFIAHGINKDEELVHLEICVDCMYYNEYGQLDDMTMDRISKNEEGYNSVKLTHLDLQALIKQYFEDFYGKATKANGFEVIDVEEAIWWYCNHYHNGGYSDLYGVLSISEYKPGLLSMEPSEGYATEFYNVLIKAYEEEKKWSLMNFR